MENFIFCVVRIVPNWLYLLAINLNIVLFYKKTATTTTQPAIACSKLTIETLEQGVKYVQS